MRDTIAQLVHPVFAHGLQLAARLRAGETVDLEQEQAILKDLLLSDFESLRWHEFGGDAASGNLAPGAESLDVRQHAADHFLGVRYLLVCWLDEMFCSQSTWGTRWNERKLEVELYGTNDRAWKFWDQAKIARSRPGTEALEVAYLCVALGFRGQLHSDAERLNTWIDSAKRRLGKVDELSWRYAADFEPPTCVPPLYGRGQLRRTALAGWISLLVLIPIVSFLLIRKLGG